VDACATKQVHEQRLDGIAAVMGYADCGGANVLTQLLEVTVTQFPGCHLNAHLMELSVGLCVEMNTVKRDAKLLAQTGDKLLVTVGLFAPQVEVAMCGQKMFLVVLTTHPMQQCHAIGTAAQSKNIEGGVGTHRGRKNRIQMLKNAGESPGIGCKNNYFLRKFAFSL
jgi:hypothetical protein